MLSDILGGDGNLEVSSRQKIFELGLGSLVIIELKLRLERSFAIRDLPVTLFFKHSSVGELADYLLTLALSHDRVPPVAPRAPTPDRANRTGLEEIENISEEQAEARLLEKLAQLEKKADV